MRRLTVASHALAICFGLGLSCCSDDPTSSNQTPYGSMSARVDGNSWSARFISAQHASGDLRISSADLRGSANRSIIIAIKKAAVGAFPIGGPDAAPGNLITYDEGSAPSIKMFIPVDGTVTITELTTTGAKGTFSATVESRFGDGSRHTITEGSFDVTFY